MTLRPLYINGRFLTQEITGTQRYAHEIIDWLDSKLAESRVGWPEVVILVPPSSELMLGFKAIELRVVGNCSGRLWEQFELPFHSRGGILFTPCGGAPLLHTRNVVTIHDAGVFVVPDSYSFLFRQWYRFLYRGLCQTSLHLLTVSKASKADLEHYGEANPEKISVMYLGAEHATRAQGTSGILNRYNLERFGYVFTLSSRSANKNLSGLLEAMKHVDKRLKLVVAGGMNSSIFAPHELLSSEVIDVGYVSDAELRELNENAACFAFPSFYEGFGLPPLEAMAAGCPVVTSNTSALAELFNTIAFACNPEDPMHIAAKISEACAAGPEYRQSCRNFASLFQWDRCARKTWALLRQLCDIESSVQERAPNMGWQSLDLNKVSERAVLKAPLR